MKMLKSKRGVAQFGNLAMEIVFVALVVAVGLILLGKFKAQPGLSNETTTAIGYGESGISEIMTWIGTVVVIVIAGYLLYLVMQFRRGGQ